MQAIMSRPRLTKAKASRVLSGELRFDPDWTMTFTQQGEYEACHAAERFLQERGFSVGIMQGPSPRAIMLGDYQIAKWRNLSREDIAKNHGAMTGNMRTGPITIVIYGSGLAAEVEARLAAIKKAVA